MLTPLRILLFFMMFFSITLPSIAAQIKLDPELPVYLNARYKFSITLPPGEYDVFEADNGDGITVRDGKELDLRAYGAMDINIPPLDFDATIEKALENFDSVSHKELHREENTFVLIGKKGNNFLTIKCIHRDGYNNWLWITFPIKGTVDYTSFTGKVLKNFK